MPSTAQIHRTNHFPAIVSAISSLIIVMFLGYIDEGYYDFRWMKDPGNWFVLGIYFIILFAFQLLIFELLLKRLLPKSK